VTQATDYGAWGDIIREQKTDDSEYRYSYQGQFSEKDLETGWSHFELREYDPIIGRWLVPDPMGQHWSPYIAMGNDPVNSVDPDGGKDGPGDECPECAGWGAMLPSVEVSGEFTGSIGGSLEGLHFAGLTGTGYTSYDDAGNWYQTINRMEGNLTYMYSNNEWSLYRDDARLKNAHLANVVSAADAVGKGTEFAISGALGGFGSALENTSLAAGRHYSQSLVPQIGNKLKYVFGQATGDAHNIERSTSMFAQLKKIGIFNNAAGNVYLRQHLGKVLNSSLGTMQSNGRILKESILMGPNGALKMESIWEGTKLITIKLIGG